MKAIIQKEKFPDNYALPKTPQTLPESKQALESAGTMTNAWQNLGDGFGAQFQSITVVGRGSAVGVTCGRQWESWAASLYIFLWVGKERAQAGRGCHIGQDIKACLECPVSARNTTGLQGSTSSKSRIANWTPCSNTWARGECVTFKQSNDI